MKNNRLSVYVSSPYSYRDILNVFLHYFQLNWKGCPYQLVLSTNYDLHFDKAVIINSEDPNDSWVKRSINALKLVRTKYVLLLCDDLFINSAVNNDDIEYILDEMDKHKVNYCSFIPSKKGVRVNNSDILLYLNKDLPYGLNLQKGIYNRDYLLSLLGDGTLSAWEMEKKWLNETTNSKGYYTDKYIVNRHILTILHGVEKGKWKPSVLKKIRKKGIIVDDNRKIMPLYEELCSNFRQWFIYIFTPKMRHKVGLYTIKK